MKIGIVGLGSIGSRHAANAAKLGHEVIVYDPQGQCDVKFERDIYDKADAVVIATPTYCHEAGLRACIERGKHALIEKPISTSLGRLPALLDRAREKDLVVMMGNNLRFHPSVKKAKEWLGERRIGQVLWAHFTCAQANSKALYLSDGVILNSGAHEVDLALFLCGTGRVAAASARLTRSDEDLGGDDIADFVIEHASGVRSSFHLDFVTPIATRDFRIVGDDGSLFCDLRERNLIVREIDGILPDVSYMTQYIGLGSWDTDYLDEMSAFIARIEGLITPPGADGFDGLEALRVLLDVRKKVGL